MTSLRLPVKSLRMAVYTSVEDSVLAAWLLHTYGMRLCAAEGIAQGVENTNYRVRMEAASGQEIQAILTIYEKRVQPFDIPFFLEVMQHFSRHGVVCPQPLLRLDGAVCGVLAEKPAALFTFLSGAPCASVTPDAVRALGKSLARMHDAARDFLPERVNTLSLEGWRRMAQNILKANDELLMPLRPIIGDELPFQAQNFPDMRSLPHGVIHADMFPDNVFFEGDAVCGVIDFYFACTDAFAYDLAITLNAWCFTPQHRFDAALATALMQGYQSVRRLNAAEQAAFPTLLRGAALRFLLTRAYDWIHTPPDAVVARKDPREYAEKLGFWRQHSGADFPLFNT